MLDQYKNILNNKFINFAGVLAIFLSPLADAIGGSNAFTYLTIFLILLFIFGVYDETKKIKKFQIDTIHIPIVIKVDDGPNVKYVIKNLIKNIEEEFDYNDYEGDLKKYFSIDIDTLMFEYNGSIYDFDRLISFVWNIKYKLQEIEHQLEGKVKFHIAYYKRPAIGFLIGTLFRTEGIVVYQNNDFKDTFEKVADINSRKYKERVDSFTKYKITEEIADENLDDILIVINSASHNVNTNAKQLRKYKNTIHISLIENGTIPYESDWTLYANEIYNIVNKLQTKYTSITIAHSMPEAISVILGMALENYWNIHITQYDNNDYKKVFTMNKIKYYS